MIKSWLGTSLEYFMEPQRKINVKELLWKYSEVTLCYKIWYKDWDLDRISCDNQILDLFQSFSVIIVHIRQRQSAFDSFRFKMVLCKCFFTYKACCMWTFLSYIVHSLLCCIGSYLILSKSLIHQSYDLMGTGVGEVVVSLPSELISWLKKCWNQRVIFTGCRQCFDCLQCLRCNAGRASHL